MTMLDFILRILELGAWPAVVAFLLYVAYLVLKFWMEKEKAKFDIFYEKKVRISQDVIQKIWELEKAVKEYVSLQGVIDGEEHKQALRDFEECLKQLNDSFEPNRIFFDELLAERIEYLRDSYNEIGNEFFHTVRSDLGQMDKVGKMLELNQRLEKESLEIRRQIENDIRKHLPK